MSVGIKDKNDEPLFSLKMPPWSSLPKTSLRPRNTDFVIEIDRRAALYDIRPTPRPRNWSRKSTAEWLEHNPVRDQQDIEFLRTEVSRLCGICERAAQQSRSSSGILMLSGGSAAGGRNWRGPVPYLRVIMALTQDNVKSLFLTRANVRTRQELDGRNSENRYVRTRASNDFTCKFYCFGRH